MVRLTADTYARPHPPRHGVDDGEASRVPVAEPDAPVTGRNRSETGQGLPWVSSTACTRCLRLERWRTRCRRQRARSRSARTSGSGSQMAGTRSRRASSASTQASMRSVAGEGRQPFHFCASAISTCQPASSSSSCTKRAPFIDSIAARTGCAVPNDALAQAAQSISIRRSGATFDCRTLAVEQVEVETLATEIQSGVQHCNGPPFVYRGRAEHCSAGGPSSWHSLPWRFRSVTRVHARSLATPVSPANRAESCLEDASPDVARVVSDVSVLCSRSGGQHDNGVGVRWVTV